MLLSVESVRHNLLLPCRQENKADLSLSVQHNVHETKIYTLLFPWVKNYDAHYLVNTFQDYPNKKS